MKSLIAAAALTAVAAIAAPAAAQEANGFYGNVGYTFVNADDLDVDLGALGAKVGYKFNPYIGVEGEAAFGVDDDNIGPVKVELEHTVAAYVVGFVPVNAQFELLGRVGYGTTEVKASGFGASVSGDDSSWNLGVGAQYFFTANDGVRAEYTKYGVDDDGIQADAWTVSYARRF
jgi:opacity protein-like surface antigen